MLVDVIAYLGTYDQVNLSALAGVGVLVRRVQALCEVPFSWNWELLILSGKTIPTTHFLRNRGMTCSAGGGRSWTSSASGIELQLPVSEPATKERVTSDAKECL